MKLYRAENTNVFGTKWIFAKSKKSAHQIGVACGMVRDPRNLTITEEPEDTFKNTDIKDVKVEGIGQCWANKEGKGEWRVTNKNEILKNSTSHHYFIC